MSEMMNSLPVSDFWSTNEKYAEVYLSLLGLFSEVKTESGLRNTEYSGQRNKKGSPCHVLIMHFTADWDE